MAVRAGAGDEKGVGQSGGGGSGEIAFESAAQGVDLSVREMGDVGNGPGFDFAVEAEGLAEENGGRGGAVGDGGDVHAYIIHVDNRYYKHIN